MSIGFVYCLSNYCMPGICKIGMTDRSPSQRVNELSASTSVPTEFSIEFYVEVENARRVELAVHDHFDCGRFNPGREFFQCTPLEVYEAIKGMDVIMTEYVDPGVLYEIHLKRVELFNQKTAILSLQQ